MHQPSRAARRRPLSALVAAAFVAAASGLAATPDARAAEAAGVQVEGQAIAPTATVAGTELKLNGVGVRAWTVYKMYVAALYLPKKATTVADVVGQSGAKRVQLRILLSVGGASGYLADAFTGGIKKRVTPDQYTHMKDRIDAFDKLVRGLDTKKGDLVNLDYVPDAGLTLALNGKVVGKPVPGADLYDAMLKIWVGDDAKDKPLRAAMLGGPPN